MRKIQIWRRVAAVAVMGFLTTAGTASAANAEGPRPPFQLPFECGQQWRLETWGQGHYPALDMFREPDDHGTEGSLLIAPADGVVEQSDDHPNAGNMIQISHGGGWFTTYLHLQSRSVDAGREVSQGQEIGRVGKTGWTSGGYPHLHFEQAFDSNGDGSATWGEAGSEAVRSVFDGVDYGDENTRKWENVTSRNSCG